MVQILASTTQKSIDTVAPWKNRIHAMADGTRVQLYTDGTNLLMETSTNGSTWAAPVTLFTRPNMDALIDSVVVAASGTASAAIWIFVGSGVNLLAYKVPYSGGVFGSVAGPTTVATLTSTPLSVRCAFDINETPYDSNHTSGSGVIYLLADSGSAWNLFALDPHSSVTGGIKSVASTSRSISLASPSAATNMIVRAAGKCYVISPNSGAVGSGGASWSACEFTFTPGSAATGSSLSFTAPALGQWFADTTTDLTNWPSTGIAYEPVGRSLTGIFYTPVRDTATGSWGYQFTPTIAANDSVPSGTWTISIPVTSSNLRGVLWFYARVYSISATGSKTLLWDGSSSSSPGTVTLSSTGSYTATITHNDFLSYGLYAGDHLYVEVDVYVHTSLSYNADGSTTYGAGNVGIALGSPSLTIPNYPTSAVSPSFTVGSSESPTFANSPQGAALIVSDTSTNPGIDLFIAGSGGVISANRTNVGGYGTATAIGSSPPTFVAGAGVTAAFDPATGNKVAFTLATFSGNQHVAYVKKTSTWGTWAQLDSDFPSTPVVDVFVTVSGSNYGAIGPAVTYTSGTGTYTLRYEDGGGVTGTGGFSGVGLIGTGVFGNSSPYNCVNTAPTLVATYVNTSTSDALGTYRWQVTHSGPTTDWDSGSVPAPTSPRIFPNGQLQTPYGSVGTAPINPALSPGTVYTIGVQGTDVSTGSSFGPTTATVYMYTAPVIAITGPSPIASVHWQPVFTYAQAESLNGVSYVCEILDPVSLAVLYQGTPVVATVTPGSTTTAPVQDLTAAFQSGKLQNNQTYISQVTVYTQPPQGSAIVTNSQLTTPLQLPPPPKPYGVSSPYITGDPLDGEYVLLGWVEDPASGVPDAMAFNIYVRIGSGDATLIATCDIAGNLVTKGLASGLQLRGVGAQGTPITGTTFYSRRVYSIPNGQRVAVGVSSVSSLLLESEIVWGGNPVNVDFRYGWCFEDIDNPLDHVELGIRSPQNSTPYEWEKLQDKDLAALFNRSKPAITVGTLYAKHTKTNPKLILETGFEEGCLTLLEKWEQNGTTLQIRDPLGHMIYGTLMNCFLSFETMPLYKSVELELNETDDATSSGVVI